MASVYHVRLTAISMSLLFLGAVVLSFFAGRYQAQLIRLRELSTSEVEPDVKDLASVGDVAPHHSHVGEEEEDEEEDEDGDDEEDEEDEDDEDEDDHCVLFRMDIDYVSAAFANSEDSLKKTMVKLLDSLDKDAFSTQCERLANSRILCNAPITTGGHLLVQSWPRRRAIKLDLLVMDSEFDVYDVPLVEDLFAVPPSGAEDQCSIKPQASWSHVRRCFPSENGRNVEDVDMSGWLLGGWFESKKPVLSMNTDMQKVDVFDIIDFRKRPRGAYQRSLEAEGSYEAAHSELFKPDRILFLDHIMQSRLFGEAAYHEALVHPALFSTENPRRVAIIGGGEGATLREVLKHMTVEKVTMIEIDGELVAASKEYLPEWNDCSNISGVPSCYDDPRSEIFFTDAIAWFVERFSDVSSLAKDELYDVIIMDALDPDSVVEFSDVLYNNDAFVRALSNSLREDGVLVAQLGEEYGIDDPPFDADSKGNTKEFLSHLHEQGFETSAGFAEAHGGFHGVWSYLVAFKDKRTKERWFSSEAEFNLRVQQRGMSTLDTTSPFRYFDGGSMMAYQTASRVNQEVFCRSKKTDCTKRVPPSDQIVPSNGSKSLIESMAALGVGTFNATQGLIERGFVVNDKANMMQLGMSNLTPTSDTVAECELSTQEMFHNVFLDRNYLSLAATSQCVDVLLKGRH